MKLMTLQIAGTLAECPGEDCKGGRRGLPYYEICVSHGKARNTLDACPYCATVMVKRGFHVPPEAIEFVDAAALEPDIPPEPVAADATGGGKNGD